jgi:hypothetical protein
MPVTRDGNVNLSRSGNWVSNNIYFKKFLKSYEFLLSLLDFIVKITEKEKIIRKNYYKYSVQRKLLTKYSVQKKILREEQCI